MWQKRIIKPKTVLNYGYFSKRHANFDTSMSRNSRVYTHQPAMCWWNDKHQYKTRSFKEHCNEAAIDKNVELAEHQHGFLEPHSTKIVVVFFWQTMDEGDRKKYC